MPSRELVVARLTPFTGDLKVDAAETAALAAFRNARG